MTNLMNSAYINALLADASYVTLSDENGVDDPEEILAGLALRLTQPLANFITANFEVLNQEPDEFLSGFSATVWRGKVGTEYSGQVYVSMRGTAGFQDISDDGDLVTTGVAYNQLSPLRADSLAVRRM